jgi:hypothetical protein
MVLRSGRAKRFRTQKIATFAPDRGESAKRERNKWRDFASGYMPDPDLARATEGAIPSAQCAHFKKTSVPSSIFVPRACLFDCMKEYWSFFATIDEDLHHFSRFVEFSEDNYKTYSAHLVRLYLAIGSEIDVVAKLLCRQIDSQKRPERINQYRPVITGRYPKLQDLQIHVRGTSITLTPWSD